MKYFPLLWAALWRKRARTIFTLLSIVVAFMLFGLLQGVNAWLIGAVEASHMNRLYVRSRVSFVEPMPLAYLTQIERVPGVRHVAFLRGFGGYYQEPKNFVPTWPCEARRIFAVFPEWKVPEDQLAALERTRTGAIIGAELARRFGWKIGDRVPLRSQAWVKKDGGADWAFDIVGVYDIPEDSKRAQMFLFNFAYFDESLPSDNGKVGAYILSIDDPARAADIAAAIDARFANSPQETSTQSEKESTQAQLDEIGDVGFIVNAVAGAVFFTLLFLTGNTMMQSARERIPEIGVMKTLGFPQALVIALMLAEALLLCLAGALIGLALAAAIFPLMRAMVGIAKLPSIVVLWGIGAAVLLALLASLPPVWRTRRLTIVGALARR